MKATFSVNRYDYEGDVYDEGLFIHLGETFTIKLKDTSELDELILNLQVISNEVKENYSGH